MAEAERKGPRAVRGDSQNESGLPQVCNLEPAGPGRFCPAQRVGQNLAHKRPLLRKSGGLVGTRGGRKIAGCNRTQPYTAGRKSLINPELLGRKSVPLSPDGCS